MIRAIITTGALVLFLGQASAAPPQFDFCQAQASKLYPWASQGKERTDATIQCLEFHRSQNRPVAIVPTKPSQSFEPPKEYDYFYPGTFDVVPDVPEYRLRQLCAGKYHAGDVALGCAIVRGDTCTIYLADEQTVARTNITLLDIFRHERAHCNDWVHD